MIVLFKGQILKKDICNIELQKRLEAMQFIKKTYIEKEIGFS